MRWPERSRTTGATGGGADGADRERGTPRPRSAERGTPRPTADGAVAARNPVESADGGERRPGDARWPARSRWSALWRIAGVPAGPPGPRRAAARLDTVRPMRMSRVALVAPLPALRDVLVRIADEGTVEFDPGTADGSPVGPAARLAQQLSGPVSPRLALSEPDLDELVRAGRSDLLAGEAALQGHAADAVRRGEVAALVGWCPAPTVPALTARLSAVGGAVVVLPRPGGSDPPTMLRAEHGLRGSFAPLVRTYGTVPYRDLDPTLPAALAYVLMFGMMFGDAGHGALLLVIAALLRLGRPARIARLRRVWPFVVGAGLASIVFGLLYGEFFGPTGVVPVLWLAPLEEPVPLLTAAVAIGAVLLAFAYALAVVNRWREGGPRLALYSASGIGGSTVFLGLGGITAGIYLHTVLLTVLGGAIAAVGLGLVAVRLVMDSGGGVEGVIGVAVGMFDLLMRLGSNLVSFARLAAFGLTHAALSWLFWRGTVGLAGHGVVGLLGAALLFAVGTAVAFTLEALVAGVQALRLEFYELFSRVFETEGHPFRPWHVPLESRAAEESS